jgi:hypothetical protein
MGMTLTLTDATGIEGLQAYFGNFIDTQIAATAADAAAAAASAAAALLSQNAAAGSATAAGNSAAAALASAAAASTSATNAANSASAASGSATAAANSASAASTSAGNASTSASNAAASATAAAGSATAAATSASNAAATLANALTKANNLSDVANVTTARGNLVAAKSGANSDITSLTGLTTALSVGQGGSGLQTATAHAVLLGEGASAFAFATVGTAGRVLVDNGAGNDPSFQSIGVLTGKNKIINGAALVAQYGTSRAYAAAASGYGGPDRFWAANNGSAGGQFTQSQGTITFGGTARAAIVQTVNTAIALLTSTNYWSGITQKIEGYNAFDLVGGTACLSFIFSTNVTGTYSISLQDGTQANSYVTTFAATSGTPVKISIPIASLPTSLSTALNTSTGLWAWIGALNQGTYQTSTTGSWQAANVISASGATNWAVAVNNFIAATEIQLEAGSVATAFERRKYGEELFNCQRYFFQAPTTIYGGLNGSGSFFSTQIFPAAMRATPSIVAPASATVTAYGVGSYSPTSVSTALAALGNSGALIQSTNLGSTAVSGYGNIAYASAVNYSAEL